MQSNGSDASDARAARDAARWRRALEAGVIAAVAILLVAFGVTSYRSSRQDSARLVCLSNMRTIMHEATLYAGDTGLAEASLGAGRLLDAGMVPERACRCPLGGASGPEYLITIRDGRPVAVVCPIDPREHVWTPETP